MSGNTNKGSNVNESANALLKDMLDITLDDSYTSIDDIISQIPSNDLYILICNATPASFDKTTKILNEIFSEDISNKRIKTIFVDDEIYKKTESNPPANPPANSPAIENQNKPPVSFIIYTSIIQLIHDSMDSQNDMSKINMIINLKDEEDLGSILLLKTFQNAVYIRFPKEYMKIITKTKKNLKDKLSEKDNKRVNDFMKLRQIKTLPNKSNKINELCDLVNGVQQEGEAAVEAPPPEGAAAEAPVEALPESEAPVEGAAEEAAEGEAEAPSAAEAPPESEAPVEGAAAVEGAAEYYPIPNVVVNTMKQLRSQIDDFENTINKLLDDNLKYTYLCKINNLKVMITGVEEYQSNFSDILKIIIEQFNTRDMTPCNDSKESINKPQEGGAPTSDCTIDSIKLKINSRLALFESQLNTKFMFDDDKKFKINLQKVLDKSYNNIKQYLDKIKISPTKDSINTAFDGLKITDNSEEIDKFVQDNRAELDIDANKKKIQESVIEALRILEIISQNVKQNEELLEKNEKIKELENERKNRQKKIEDLDTQIEEAKKNKQLANITAEKDQSIQERTKKQEKNTEIQRLEIQQMQDKAELEALKTKILQQAELSKLSKLEQENISSMINFKKDFGKDFKKQFGIELELTYLSHIKPESEPKDEPDEETEVGKGKGGAEKASITVLVGGDISKDYISCIKKIVSLLQTLKAIPNLNEASSDPNGAIPGLYDHIQILLTTVPVTTDAIEKIKNSVTEISKSLNKDNKDIYKVYIDKFREKINKYSETYYEKKKYEFISECVTYIEQEYNFDGKYKADIKQELLRYISDGKDIAFIVTKIDGQTPTPPPTLNTGGKTTSGKIDPEEDLKSYPILEKAISNNKHDIIIDLLQNDKDIVDAIDKILKKESNDIKLKLFDSSLLDKPEIKDILKENLPEFYTTFMILSAISWAYNKYTEDISDVDYDFKDNMEERSTKKLKKYKDKAAELFTKSKDDKRYESIAVEFFKNILAVQAFTEELKKLSLDKKTNKADLISRLKTVAEKSENKHLIELVNSPLITGVNFKTLTSFSLYSTSFKNTITNYHIFYRLFIELQQRINFDEINNLFQIARAKEEEFSKCIFDNMTVYNAYCYQLKKETFKEFPEELQPLFEDMRLMDVKSVREIINFQYKNDDENNELKLKTLESMLIHYFKVKNKIENLKYYRLQNKLNEREEIKDECHPLSESFKIIYEDGFNKNNCKTYFETNYIDVDKFLPVDIHLIEPPGEPPGEQSREQSREQPVVMPTEKQKAALQGPPTALLPGGTPTTTKKNAVDYKIVAENEAKTAKTAATKAKTAATKAKTEEKTAATTLIIVETHTKNTQKAESKKAAKEAAKEATKAANAVVNAADAAKEAAKEAANAFDTADAAAINAENAAREAANKEVDVTDDVLYAANAANAAADDALNSANEAANAANEAAKKAQTAKFYGEIATTAAEEYGANARQETILKNEQNGGDETITQYYDNNIKKDITKIIKDNNIDEETLIDSLIEYVKRETSFLNSDPTVTFIKCMIQFITKTNINKYNISKKVLDVFLTLRPLVEKLNDYQETLYENYSRENPVVFFVVKRFTNKYGFYTIKFLNFLLNALQLIPAITLIPLIAITHIHPQLQNFDISLDATAIKTQYDKTVYNKLIKEYNNLKSDIDVKEFIDNIDLLYTKYKGLTKNDKIKEYREVRATTSYYGEYYYKLNTDDSNFKKDIHKRLGNFVKDSSVVKQITVLDKLVYFVKTESTAITEKGKANQVVPIVKNNIEAAQGVKQSGGGIITNLLKLRLRSVLRPTSTLQYIKNFFLKKIDSDDILFGGDKKISEQLSKFYTNNRAIVEDKDTFDFKSFDKIFKFIQGGKVNPIMKNDEELITYLKNPQFVESITDIAQEAGQHETQSQAAVRATKETEAAAEAAVAQEKQKVTEAAMKAFQEEEKQAKLDLIRAETEKVKTQTTMPSVPLPTQGVPGAPGSSVALPGTTTTPLGTTTTALPGTPGAQVPLPPEAEKQLQEKNEQIKQLEAQLALSSGVIATPAVSGSSIISNALGMDIIEKAHQEHRINKLLIKMKDFYKYIEEKSNKSLDEIDSFVATSFNESVGPKINEYATKKDISAKEKNEIKSSVRKFVNRFLSTISHRSSTIYSLMKLFFLKENRHSVAEFLRYRDTYVNLTSDEFLKKFKTDAAKSKRLQLEQTRYKEIVKIYNDISKQYVVLMNKFYDNLITKTTNNIKADIYYMLDDDIRMALNSKTENAIESMRNNKEKIISLLTLNYSIMDMVLDSQFLVMYIIKVIRIAFVYLSAFLATRVFMPVYEEAVYDNKENPPSLARFLLIFFAFDLSFNAFLLVLLFLLKFLFKTEDNSFVIDKYLFSKYATDWLISTFLLLVISFMIGLVIMSKKYFKYKFEGQRAIRSFGDIVFYVACVLYTYPFFLTI